MLSIKPHASVILTYIFVNKYYVSVMRHYALVMTHYASVMRLYECTMNIYMIVIQDSAWSNCVYSSFFMSHM